MSLLSLGIVLFLISILLIELTFYAVRLIRYPDQAEIRKRLRQSVSEEDAGPNEVLAKRQVLSDVPFFDRILATLPGVQKMQLTLRQANVPYTLGFVFFLSLVLAMTGYLLGYALLKNGVLAIVAAAGLGWLPTIHVQSKKRKRMMQFEKQLPDALGLIARALRAGHAFSSGMKIASEEMADPMGPELGETLDEINFGVSVSDALRNLARRVDCLDVKFFVVSVTLQRETGGNLAEIIEGLATLIRERFKFRGKVRVLSAEGRISGLVLVVLPFLLTAVLFVANREFIAPLVFDPMGRIMIGVGLSLMTVGVFFIRRIIKVDI